MTYLIRHAEKENSSVHARLTKNGLDTSFKFGKKLKEKGIKIDLIISSPIKRCIQTAKEITKGYGEALEIRESKLLGDNGVYIKDSVKAMEIFNRYSLLDVINMQLSDIKLEGFNSIKDGSEELLEFINRQEKNSIMVSHDAIITPFISYINGVKRIEEKDIVDYLEVYKLN